MPSYSLHRKKKKNTVVTLKQSIALVKPAQAPAPAIFVQRPVSLAKGQRKQAGNSLGLGGTPVGMYRDQDPKFYLVDETRGSGSFQMKGTNRYGHAAYESTAEAEPTETRDVL